jgi:hypothetical protein
MVVTLREGNSFDPRVVKDVSLVAYRDAIDFLGYFVDGSGSMIDGIGKDTTLARRVISSRIGKLLGWRLNCVHDESARSEPVMVSVKVPKAHPLLICENDDPL